jgi:hypothetical protein
MLSPRWMIESDLPTVDSPRTLWTHPTVVFESLAAHSNQLAGLSVTWNVTPVAWAMPAPSHQQTEYCQKHALLIHRVFLLDWANLVTTVVKLH